ncbi:glycosyltransferase [Leucobacter weissii]|uniref:Glycosyltransferase n=1 Tax=Leucobacter weissii TaxID=1983706 RepID=A0A939SAI7_9MICO|nr:glycosyltransferase [Leucobacter weissii]MBO1901992.1 glycosyltransferase [Leucobacter weissii]
MSVRTIRVSPEIAHDASQGLWERDPGLSARRVLSRPQGWGIAVCAFLYVLAAVLWTRDTIVATLLVTSLAFLSATAFKFWVSLRGARYDLADRIDPEEIAALDDAELPVYTVLVPVFREANIVHQLVDNLGAIDYPAARLEVLILVEEEDEETRAAVDASDAPDNFTVVIVPQGQPQTKPRACNVGLAIARGEYLVIYDAEDAPEPLQLKKALLAFSRAGDRTAVMQASLNYFNAGENVLTRMFTLEYAYWFDYMLPGLDIDALPIPLGGTSNHFRTTALRELGGWDPFNVTEDADLGIRASALGYQVGIVDSVTMEEANTSIPNFVRQRSRWIKGYMQTTLVHARSPLRLIREIGLRRFAGFALLVAGTPLTFLGVLPFILLTGITWLLPSHVIDPLFPPAVAVVTLFNFLIGSGMIVYLNMMGPFKRGDFELVPWALLNPVYWILHSVASYKALWQLVVRPHYWEKTEHGLTTHRADGGGQ